jgi:hypothetical protein
VFNGQPVWIRGDAEFLWEWISAGHWEVRRPGNFRPARCDTEGAGPGAGPSECTDWEEYRGSTFGFVSVPVIMNCTN